MNDDPEDLEEAERAADPERHVADLVVAGSRQIARSWVEKSGIPAISINNPEMAQGRVGPSILFLIQGYEHRDWLVSVLDLAAAHRWMVITPNFDAINRMRFPDRESCSWLMACAEATSIWEHAAALHSIPLDPTFSDDQRFAINQTKRTALSLARGRMRRLALQWSEVKRSEMESG